MELMSDNSNGWSKAERMVLHELSRLSQTTENILKAVNEIRTGYVIKEDYDKLKDEFLQTRLSFETFKATQMLRNAMISAGTGGAMAVIVGLVVTWLSK